MPDYYDARYTFKKRYNVAVKPHDKLTDIYARNYGKYAYRLPDRSSLAYRGGHNIFNARFAISFFETNHTKDDEYMYLSGDTSIWHVDWLIFI